MHSQTKVSGVKLPEVHSVDKGIDPGMKQERQLVKFPSPAIQPNKPILGQGREGPRREMSVPT